MDKVIGATELKSRLLGLLLAILFIPVSAFAQNQRTVTGTVNDETGEPLIGASVKVAGEAIGTSTDFDGHYTLKVPAGAKQLTFTYVGYQNLTVDITSDVIDVTMRPNAEVLDEVVVIGYGVRKKDDLTGSISTISEKDFNQGVITSPEELINGKMPGVQIVNSGGATTGGSTIRIRGGASLNASNDPLIVIDGVPMEVGGYIQGQGNFLSMINPNDIESMTVLKDASSTAIYGSRASNGVILITTKKGKGDGIKVSFQTTNSVSTKTKTANMLSRDEFVDVIRTRGSEAQIALLGNENTDWTDEVMQTGFGTDNNISVSGRVTDWLPFRVSLGALYQEGIMKNDENKRFSGNINLSPSFFNDDLKFTISGKASYNTARYPSGSIIWNATTYNPTIPVYSGNDAFLGYNEPVDINGIPVTGATANPVGLLNYRNKAHTHRLIGSVDVDYRVRFLPELRFHATAAYDRAQGKSDYYTSAESWSGFNQGGSISCVGPKKAYNKLFTIYGNYNKEFDAIKSAVDVTVGYDYQWWKRYSPYYESYNEAGEVQSTSAPTDERHTLLSYYGRLNYTFDNRYLLTATFRRDGSSRFAKDKRWGTFPSVALAWRVSNESFWDFARDVMNDLKIRVSYGETGQQDGIANYSHMPVYTISQEGAQYVFNGIPIFTYRPEAYNPDLKWETTKAWNVGLDFGFMNNRITGTVDYYKRKTEDLLASVPCAAGTNFAKYILSNVGNVDSEGFELSINANIIDNKDWSWNVAANATWQKSRITNLTMSPDAESPNTLVGSSVDSRRVQVFSTGYAPYSFYVYKQIYDPKTGRPIEGVYADLNNDGQINSSDLYHYHSPAPDWILGLSTSLRYRKWTLSTSLRANIGNYVYNAMAMNTGAWETVSYNAYQLNNMNRSYLDTGFSMRQHYSDHYVENASFLKMDNLQLSYDFGNVWRSVNLHLSANIQNVFTITNYSGIDPEVSYGIDSNVYPRPRTYSLTVGLNF